MKKIAAFFIIAEIFSSGAVAETVPLDIGTYVERYDLPRICGRSWCLERKDAWSLLIKSKDNKLKLMEWLTVDQCKQERELALQSGAGSASCFQEGRGP
jgi:hypothetical protein